MSEQTRQSVLAGIKTTLNQQANELGERVARGLKNGFTASMTRMFGTSLWFIVVGLLVVPFIPVIPMRGATNVTKREQQADGKPAASD
ncbi:hypothetical protein [Deinococcus humi]|uniref:Uncharacterized protein n=1 Tax=Deinococcus humi TaxID=662880 RepID=A0A7W8K2F7_9DEIO|nr:hypothetical protein [Deinococcus humi]MBB5366054.1 hypothetical protein [Deinococcus humi]GGO39876.1 hypothetical protein GCM10008949_48610 [Deinococcus humi]